MHNGISALTTTVSSDGSVDSRRAARGARLQGIRAGDLASVDSTMNENMVQCCLSVGFHHLFDGTLHIMSVATATAWPPCADTKWRQRD